MTSDACPTNFNRDRDIAHGQWQLTVRLHIQFVVRADKGFIRTRRHTNTDLAPGLFDQRKISFESPDEGKLVEGFQNPRLRSASDLGHFLNTAFRFWRVLR